MPESVWIVGFIIVLAITIAQCRVRAEKEEDESMDGSDCAKLLAALKPPLPSLKRKDYRPYVTAWVEGLDMEQARALCAYFACDISTVVTRIMDWQYSRARAGIDLAQGVGTAARKSEIRSTKPETSTNAKTA